MSPASRGQVRTSTSRSGSSQGTFTRKARCGISVKEGLDQQQWLSTRRRYAATKSEVVNTARKVGESDRIYEFDQRDNTV
jgi:hypothetical protein